MTMTEFLDELHHLSACKDAVAWAGTQPDTVTLWHNCERGDWMLWLAGQHAGQPLSEERKPLVLAVCECAELAMPIWEQRFPDDIRPQRCLSLCERWARGEPVTYGDLNNAAAYVANAAYAAADAVYAANAAASAVYAAADTAANAAVYAADAVYAAADTAANARHAILRQCADIVRKHYPEMPTSKSEKRL